MESILIEPSTHSPLVQFELDGNMLLEGRAIPEDVNKLFNPMIEFVTGLKAPYAVFNINLEYFNTATSKKMLELLKHLDANNKIEKILVNWHYEDGDDDSVEMAEIYEECLMRSEFRYIMHNELITLVDKKDVYFTIHQD